jgi:hypothetical protein
MTPTHTGFLVNEKPNAALAGLLETRNPEADMPTTELPPSKEKAHEIARKIANERPLRKDKAPESDVTGGFNQKSRADEDDRLRKNEDSVTEGDG